MIWPRDDASVREAFKKDIDNVHLLYDYDAENPETGAPEKWRYEMWFRSENRIVYVTGSHTWENFQDVTQSFDYPAYLDRLTALHHNFIRLWVTESIRSDGGWLMNPPPNEKDIAPLPYLRTGPGRALDGGPRLDVSRFNPDYFERLRARVTHAGQRGLYVSVMFFQGFSVVTPGAWKAHPLNGENNVNGIDGDANDTSVGELDVLWNTCDFSANSVATLPPFLLSSLTRNTTDVSAAGALHLRENFDLLSALGFSFWPARLVHLPLSFCSSTALTAR